jgi:hypothetical protein
MRRMGYFAIAAIISLVGLTHTVRADDDDHRDLDFKHVLLISVDGMHASNLSTYVGKHPQSHLARLSAHGFTYPKALTSGPSDLVSRAFGAGDRRHAEVARRLL